MGRQGQRDLCCCRRYLYRPVYLRRKERPALHRKHHAHRQHARRYCMLRCRVQSVTEVSSPRALETPVSSSPTTPTLERPESSFHLVPRRSSTPDAELPSASSLVVDVSTSLSSRLAEPTTSTRLSVTAGLRSVVLL